MRHSILLLFAVSLLIVGCKKDPGIGGKAVIRGKIYVIEYSNNTNQPTGKEWFGQEERVYIRYGDNVFYDDDVRTGPNGEFEFTWLRKGDYTVFVYSDCNQDLPDCESGKVTIFKAASIGSKKEEVDLGTIEIEKW